MEGEIVFKAMADKTRLKLLQAILQHELSVSELVEVLGQPQSTVSRHLRVLREADLISNRRDGTAVFCAPSIPGPGRNSNSLHADLLDWIRKQGVPKPLQRRLDRVMHKRAARTLGFFDKVGERWDQMRIECFGERFPLEAMVSLLPSEWTVTDIGTGTGYLLPMLVPCFQRVIAVDPVDAMLEKARSRPELSNAKNLEYRQGDLSRLPIPDQGVDLALAVLVLHHVPSTSKALGELFRVVRSGGHVLIVEQRAHNLKEFHDRMQDRWWGFEPEWLVEQTEGIGFMEIKWRELNSVEPNSGSVPECPDLFVLTARKPGATRSLS
jgi:ArsR family transcriptional regulator